MPRCRRHSVGRIWVHAHQPPTAGVCADAPLQTIAPRDKRTPPSRLGWPGRCQSSAPLDLAQINAHRKIKQIGKRRAIERELQPVRQDVQRKQMPARDVFKGEEHENDRRNLQQPKGQQGHGVGHEKLQQARQQRRKQKAPGRRPARRRDRYWRKQNMKMPTGTIETAVKITLPERKRQKR